VASTLNVTDLLRDAEFRRLSPEAQLHGLREVDKDFGALSLDAQLAALDDPEFKPVPDQRMVSPTRRDLGAPPRQPPLDKPALRAREGPQLELEPTIERELDGLPPGAPGPRLDRQTALRILDERLDPRAAAVNPSLEAPARIAGVGRNRPRLVARPRRDKAGVRIDRDLALTPDSTLGSRAEDLARNYAFGDVPQERARDVQPNTVNVPLLLPSPEEVERITDRDAQLAVAAVRGAARVAQGFTHPEAVGLVAATAGAGALGRGAVTELGGYFAEITEALTAAGFSAQLADGMVEAIQAGRTAATPAQAVEAYVQGGVEGLMAATGARHAKRALGRAARGGPKARAELSEGLRPGGKFRAPAEPEVIPPEPGAARPRRSRFDEPGRETVVERGQLAAPPQRAQLEAPAVERRAAAIRAEEPRPPADAEAARAELLKRRQWEKRPGDLEAAVAETLAPAASQRRTRRVARGPAEELEAAVAEGLATTPPKTTPPKPLQTSATRAGAHVIPGLATGKRPATQDAKGEVPPIPTDTRAAQAPPSPAPAPVTGDKAADKSPGLPRIPKAATERPKAAQPREPKIPAAVGREHEIRVPGAKRRYKAVYEIADLDDTIPSHNAITFQPRPDYELKNERDYAVPAAQESVLEDVAEFDSGFQLAESPTAEHGPTIIDPSQNAVSGNKRRLVLERLAEQQPAKYKKYVADLREKAAQFGLDPKQVDRFPRPHLRLRLVPEEGFDPQRAISDFNAKGSAPLTEHEQSFTDSTRISQNTLDYVTEKLDEAGESATLARALEGDAGPRVIDRLVKDEVLPLGEKRRMLDERGQLTDAAKERIANVLLGRVFRDAEQIKRTRPAIRRNLERSLPHIIRVEKRADWNVLPDVQRAVDILEYAEATGVKNLDDLARQGKMSKAPEMDARSLVIARKLREGPLKAATAFRQYANEARLSEKGFPKSFIDPPTPAEAFTGAFGALVEGAEARPRFRLGLSELQRTPDIMSTLRRPPNVPAVLYVSRPALGFLVEEGILATSPDTLATSIPLDQGSHELLQLGLRSSAASRPKSSLERDRIEQLGKNFSGLYQAARRRGDVRGTVVPIDRRPGAPLRQLLRHERFHGAQGRQALIWLDQLTTAPEFRTYRTAPPVAKGSRGLQTIGYSEATATYVELPAWIAAGQYSHIGLSRGEAVEALALYYEAAQKVRNEGAGELLRFMVPTLAKEVQLAQRSRQEARGLRLRQSSQRPDAPESRPAQRGLSPRRPEGAREEVRRADSADAGGTRGAQLRLFEARRRKPEKVDPRQGGLFGRTGPPLREVINFPTQADAEAYLLSSPYTGRTFRRESGGWSVFIDRTRPMFTPAEGAAGARDPERGAIDVDLVTLGLSKTLREDVAPAARDVAAGLSETVDWIYRLLIPSARGSSVLHRFFVPQLRGSKGHAPRTGEILRESLASMARKYDRAEKAMAKAQRFFRDRPAAANFDFIRKVESGAPQAPVGKTSGAELDAIAAVLRSILDGRRADVQALGKGKLQKFYQNYFPHVWKQRRGAHNADTFFGEWFGRRPLEGKKAFLKKRTHPTFEDGLNAGLEPVSDNPVELVLLKVREMDRYVMAHETLREFRKAGLARFVPVDRQGPTGWHKIDDPIGTVYGDPAVNVQEFFDARVMNQLNSFAKSMGFQILTSQRLPGGAAGVAYKGTGQVKRKFATPWDVVAHEIGHQLDWKYSMQARLLKRPPPAGLTESKADRDRRISIQKQLRALADLRYEGAVPSPAFANYVRRKEEKMAAVVQAYLYAPDKLKQAAPDVYAEFETLIAENPTQLGALRHIKPSLVMGSNESQFRIQGLLIKGHWWMPEPAAVVFNNHLMPGLRSKSGLFRAALGGNNVLNQAQLGFSAFHLANTMYDSVASKFGLGFYNLVQGKPSGLAHMLEAPLGPLIHQYYGHRLRNEWFRPGRGGAELARIVEAMTMAGGRVRMDIGFRTNFRDKFLQALRRGNIFGAAWRAPFALVETAAWPIMEFIVPRQKLGVFYELAQTEMARLGPNASRDDVRRALQKVWDVVDDRLGEVVYDNLFWNRYAKDMMMISVRSVGWNWGTFRVLFGGAADIAKLPVRAGLKLAGRGDSDPALSHRAAYMLGFVGLTAAIGAILMKLLTGEWPETIEDYFFPRTGELDENGRPRRLSQPTYLKDAMHYYHDAPRTLANKVSPVVDLLGDMLSNKDFYGTEIRHPGDPLFDQFLDVLKRSGEAFTPFGFREMQRAEEQGRSTRAKVLPFFGLVPAPKIITSSPAEEFGLEALRDKRPVGARTKLESERAQLRARLRTAFRQKLHNVPGGLSPADVARQGGQAGLFTRQDLVRAAREARQSPIVSVFKRLELEDALGMYELADPDERRMLNEAMWGEVDPRTGRRKGGKVELLLNKPPAEQQRLAARIRALLPARQASSAQGSLATQ